MQQVKQNTSVRKVTTTSYNNWCKKFKVSSMWATDTPEKRFFMERLQLARYAKEMGMINS